ncbi:MAG: GNAT family N-acetyltransferase [Taibaiella sp.]|nr:GNAT family N-acetyltransferase [Taibaiella sp.]
MVNITINSNITLRTFTPEDAEALLGAINASRAHLSPWLDWIKHTTKIEHAAKYIKDSLHCANMQEGLFLGIFDNGQLTGGVTMHQWDHKLKKADIGYWLVKGNEGKGTIALCLRHFATFLFTKTGLTKIEVHFAAANKRSAKVAERLGCRIEGVIRQGTLRNGMAEDLVIAGLLKSEWEQIINSKN